MIDDKELEERAEKWLNDERGRISDKANWNRMYHPISCAPESAFIAGARSQDELAYQRGRREVLDELEKSMNQTLLHFNHRATVDMLIEQLRTEGEK